MRLTWWHNALDGLGQGPAPAEPLLRDIAAEPRLDPALLLPAIDGWEALLDPLPLDPEQIALHGRARGGGLFQAAADALGGADAGGIEAAGALWALTDLAFRISDRTTAEAAMAQARALAGAAPRRWPRVLKPLGLLTLLARRDALAGLGARRQGSPGRVLRCIGFGLFGL